MSLQPTYDPYHQPDSEKAALRGAQKANLDGMKFVLTCAVSDIMVISFVVFRVDFNLALRKPIVRRTIDYHASIINWVEV